MAATTAALAPYPVGGIPAGKKKRGKWHVTGEGPWGIHNEDGTVIKCTFRSHEHAIRECAKLNGES